MFISELTNKELTDKIIDSVLFEGLEDTERSLIVLSCSGAQMPLNIRFPLQFLLIRKTVFQNFSIRW